MASCKNCGFAVLGSGTRCAKCGAPLPVAGGAALQSAVRAATDEALGVTQARKQTERDRWVRVWAIRVAAAVAALLALCGAWYAWREHVSRAAVPLAEGTEWTFASPDSPQSRTVLRLGEFATFDGYSARVCTCERVDGASVEEPGRGYVADGWFGLDLIGLDGATGHQLLQARILPYPFAVGKAWTSRLGRSWADAPWTLSCEATGLERVTVPAGGYDALRIDFRAGLRVGGALVTGRWWMAPGTGPIRLELDASRVGYGAAGRTFELVGFKRSSDAAR